MTMQEISFHSPQELGDQQAADLFWIFFPKYGLGTYS